MKHDERFSGIHAVLFALFQDDETLDLTAMSNQADYCIEAGCHGVTILGLATEVQKLTFDEKRKLVELTAQAVGRRVPLSVTISGNSVAEQIELIHCAEKNNADWLILQPPTVGNFSADVYLRFFERVSAATELPVAIQNAPQYLGRSLSGADLDALVSACANLKAVKSEESALGIRQMTDATDGRLCMLGGRGGLELTDSLRVGCQGFLLAPDIVPVAVRLFNLWQNGRHDEAEALYMKIAPAIIFTMQSLENFIAYGKRIYASHAKIKIHDRAPSLNTTAYGLQLAQGWADHLANVLQQSH
jgi:4-hydroxy-tetrahydrodipicolinate synthase